MNIKRLVSGIVVAAFIVAGSAAHGQVLPKFGVKAGLNYSTFNNTDNAEYKAGLGAGVYARINIPATPMAIQPEALYVQYGSNFEGSDGSFSVDYIQIPVLAKFGFGAPGIPIRPEVFFGPYAGFEINSEVSGQTISADADDFFESTDAGVVVGAGLRINIINLEFRYTAGLTNVVANSNFEDNQKNGAFMLSVGIDF